MFLTSENELLLNNNILFFYSSNLNYLQFNEFFVSKNVLFVDLQSFQVQKRFSVAEIPTLIIFDNGKEIRRMSGLKDLENIFNFLKNIDI